MRLRQIQLLLQSVAESASEQATRADGDLAHRALQTFVRHIRKRIEPDLKTVSYMLKRNIECRNYACTQSQNRRKVPQAHAACQQDDNADAADDDHRRGMWLQVQQTDVQRQQQTVRLHHGLDAAHALRVTRHPVGKADDDGQLCDLRRLKAEQPAACIIDRCTDARYRNQNQQRDRYPHDDVVNARVHAVRNLGKADHRRKTDRGENALTHDKVCRAALVEHRVGIACREQRDQTGDQQQQHREEHTGIPDVRLHAAHASALRLCGAGMVTLLRHRLPRRTRRFAARRIPRHGTARCRPVLRIRLSSCRSHRVTSELRIKTAVRVPHGRPAGTAQP